MFSNVCTCKFVPFVSFSKSQIKKQPKLSITNVTKQHAYVLDQIFVL